MKDLKVDADKFDAVLRRMATMKPMSVKELSVKLKAEKAAKAEREMAETRAKIAARRVQKMDK
ncbi:hypothetical protein [Tunturiibacter gelidoferens]|jgi:hypothetical protein|uniref:Uncharacterized protein n=1 Tax=Tunturiibacter gelidiferens TaxID=3069689 RepID=A0A9X0QI23_9BACT|nr:hypothetical protein [Edaphobacter lichenicola]MBB5330856.1 hypothetical protein [Edaphobacter lichenicola]